MNNNMEFVYFTTFFCMILFILIICPFDENIIRSFGIMPYLLESYGFNISFFFTYLKQLVHS